MKTIVLSLSKPQAGLPELIITDETRLEKVMRRLLEAAGEKPDPALTVPEQWDRLSKDSRSVISLYTSTTT